LDLIKVQSQLELSLAQLSPSLLNMDMVISPEHMYLLIWNFLTFPKYPKKFKLQGFYPDPKFCI